MSDNIADLLAKVEKLEALANEALAFTRASAEAAVSLRARLDAAESRAQAAEAVLRDMVARFELYAGPNDMHAGHHDLELLRRAREALRGETK